MRITVNGDEHVVAEDTTVRALLEGLGVRTKAVAVERNRQIVPRALHHECRLAEGDRLEIVTLVGGG